MKVRLILNFSMVFFMLFFVGYLSFCSAKDVFSEKDKAKIELISRVKKYAKSIGLEPTNNFKEYRDSSTRYNLFFYNKKTEVPFSYIDPLLVYKQSDYDNLASSVIGYGINTEENDVYFYTTLGVASGTYITRNLLESGDDVIAEVVLHEDMHDNTSLPRHIDEATALLVGIAGSSRFMKSDEEDFGLFMEYLAIEATTVKKLHKNILELNKLYKKGQISFESYLTIRDLKLKVTGQESMASMVQHHTYLYYLPKLIRIFRAMDYDLKSFVVFMKAFPYKEPSWDENNDEAQELEKYFKETLRVEEEADAYLDKVIDELESKKPQTVDAQNIFEDNLFLGTNMFYFLDKLEKVRNITIFRHFKPFYK